MTDALKPCPFCGETNAETDVVSKGQDAVFCRTCGAMGPCCWGGPSQERLITAWNRRASPPDLEGVLAPLFKVHVDLNTQTGVAHFRSQEEAELFADFLANIDKLRARTALSSLPNSPSEKDND